MLQSAAGSIVQQHRREDKVRDEKQARHRLHLFAQKKHIVTEWITKKTHSAQPAHGYNVKFFSQERTDSKATDDAGIRRLNSTHYYYALKHTARVSIK